VRTWAPAAEQFERWSRSTSGEGLFSAGQLRAARPALKDVGHDKIVTPSSGCSRPRRRFETRRQGARPGRGAHHRNSCERPWQEADLLRVSGEARLLGPSADPDRARRGGGRRCRPANRARVHSSCARHCRWRNSIILRPLVASLMLHAAKAGPPRTSRNSFVIHLC
jgi:hypothetical protein